MADGVKFVRIKGRIVPIKSKTPAPEAPRPTYDRKAHQSQLEKSSYKFSAAAGAATGFATTAVSKTLRHGNMALRVPHGRLGIALTAGAGALGLAASIQRIRAATKSDSFLGGVGNFIKTSLVGSAAGFGGFTGGALVGGASLGGASRLRDVIKAKKLRAMKAF